MQDPFAPETFQPELPIERLIVNKQPSEDAIVLDVLFVGAGPAGLAGAIELKRLRPSLEVGVLEKAASLGDHSLSGAIVNPAPFRGLFPELSDREFPFRGPVSGERALLLTANRALRLPLPKVMRNQGNYVASICEMVRWLGAEAEKLGVNIFTGFPAESLLVRGERVLGVRTAPSGLDRHGRRTGAHVPGSEISAKVTVLAEGSRGALTQAWRQWLRIASPNPQIYALGVKELWRKKNSPLNAVIHTLGWPVPREVFGGSFVYPMGPDLISFGLVVGLDYRDAGLDVHQLLQGFKRHPLVRSLLEGAELEEWGAKTIPEGGFHSLAERLSSDGLLVIGDSAGLVNVAALKGIHYAMHSGILAAQAISRALREDEPSGRGLGEYDRLLRGSFICDDLYHTRNMRLAFKSGFYMGGLKAELMSVTRGRFPRRGAEFVPDSAVARRLSAPRLAGEQELRKVDAVYRSGNITRDDVPNHLIAHRGVPPEVARFYESLCPAGVYEWDGEKLIVNPANCIDCKATDVLGPRWTPREGGSGPRYRLM